VGWWSGDGVLAAVHRDKGERMGKEKGIVIENYDPIIAFVLTLIVVR
jgi:hypothetical protein